MAGHCEPRSSAPWKPTCRRAPGGGVFFLTAPAIAREGSEMVVFLYGIGMGMHADGTLEMNIAAALGLALGS